MWSNCGHFDMRQPELVVAPEQISRALLMEERFDLDAAAAVAREQECHAADESREGARYRTVPENRIRMKTKWSLS